MVLHVQHLLEHEGEFVGAKGDVLVLLLYKIERTVADAVLQVHQRRVDFLRLFDALFVVQQAVSVALASRQVD